MVNISKNTTPRPRWSVAAALLPSVFGMVVIAGCTSSSSEDDFGDDRQEGNCGEEYECINEGACEGCTPGPSGVCPERIADAVSDIGGEDMNQFEHDITKDIHNGAEPDEGWEGNDHDIHLIQEYHPQFSPDSRDDECWDAKIELGAELILDTAAVTSDLVFYGGYFSKEMREAAKATAMAEALDVEVEDEIVQYYIAATNEAHEASRIEKTGEIVFQLLGANGFTHVLFEGMKQRYDLHHWAGRWHLTSDILVGAATIASVIVPESWPAWLVKLTGFLRTVSDVANLGIDMKRNIGTYQSKCGMDTCGDGECGPLDYSYGCSADCQADYDAACNGGCGSYTGGDPLCDAYCTQCNSNSICEPGFGEDPTTCPSDCS